MKKRIKINHSKSPLNLFKIRNKEDSSDSEKVIEKIDDHASKLDYLYDENEFVSTKYEPTAKENILLRLMYLEDVDSDFVKSEMRVTDLELQKIVNNLLNEGFVKESSSNEIELTADGIYHITSNDMDLF